jgi:hypothetical protein
VAAIESVVKVATWAYDERLPQRALSYALPRVHVLMMGTSGVGKTMLIKSLREARPQPISRRDRTLATHDQRLPVSRNRRVIFWDTPGQDLHAAARRKTRIKLRNKKRLGVLNVVAYGYSERDVALQDALTQSEEPRNAWLREERAKEIARLDEWLPDLGHTSKFVLTLVSKADLWWSEEAAVRGHYEYGEYAQVIRQAGVENHYVLMFCSVITRFFDRYMPNNRFDQTDQIQLHAQLGEQLRRLVEQ